MQSSLFDMAPEPEAPAFVPAEDVFIDIFEDLPEQKPATEDPWPCINALLDKVMAPPDEPCSDLREWCRKNNHDYVLQEVVLRAKTIEANFLCSAGPDAEFKYLVEAYAGDEVSLRAAITEVSRVIRGHSLTVGACKNTDETSL